LENRGSLEELVFYKVRHFLPCDIADDCSARSRTLTPTKAPGPSSRLHKCGRCRRTFRTSRLCQNCENYKWARNSAATAPSLLSI
jgi:hypothetical protein